MTVTPLTRAGVVGICGGIGHLCQPAATPYLRSATRLRSTWWPSDCSARENYELSVVATGSYLVTAAFVAFLLGLLHDCGAAPVPVCRVYRPHRPPHPPAATRPRPVGLGPLRGLPARHHDLGKRARPHSALAHRTALHGDGLRGVELGLAQLARRFLASDRRHRPHHLRLAPHRDLRPGRSRRRWCFASARRRSVTASSMRSRCRSASARP